MTQSAWEKAPFMIGGGVNHSVESARLLAYVAGGGKEGIVKPGHLLVKALATPGTSVTVEPGACVAINRSTGVLAESYIGRLPTQDTVTIAATGATARTDMIIARVEDPFQPGNPWPVPSDANKNITQYIRTVVIPNVTGQPRTLAEAGLNYTGIPLALVVQPANNPAVQTGQIIDLRKMYLASVEPGVDELIVPGAANVLTSAAVIDWPTAMSKSVFVPSWATHVNVRAMLGQAYWGATGTNGGAGWAAAGTIQVRLGATLDSPAVAFSVDSDTGVDRGTILAGASRLAIPTSLRGTTQTIKLRAARTTGNTGLGVDAKSILSFEATFIEAPEG